MFLPHLVIWLPAVLEVHYLSRDQHKAYHKVVSFLEEVSCHHVCQPSAIESPNSETFPTFHLLYL